MADAKKPTKGSTANPPAAAAAEPVLRVVGQYVKDLSFENPNIEKRLDESAESPKISININVAAKAIKPALYESVVHLTAGAVTESGTTFYDLEISYGGLFQIEHVPEEALEQILLINAPALLFPFVRRLALDLTREGGFPPLQLDPVDFAGLYMQRQQQMAATAGKAPPTN